MYTFNGVGTRLYGRRDEAADGSYVATKWFVLVYAPVLPLGSYRVLPLGSEFVFLGTKDHYHLQRVPLNWRQVLNWYCATLFAGPLLAYIIGGGILLALW